MHATRRLANGARFHRASSHLPVLLLLRSAIALLALLALAAGAATADVAPHAGGAPRERPADAAAEGIARARPSAAPVRHRRNVFVCDDAGTPAYSDRPCGSDLILRTVSVEQPIAGRAASTVPPAPSATTRPRERIVDRGETLREADSRCKTLRRQLEEVDDRMRAGYSSREAAKLWERRRELKSELRASRC